MERGRPPKYDNPEDMQRIIDLYFIACRRNRHNEANPDKEYIFKETLSPEDIEVIDMVEESIPLVSGLAYILGMSTEAFRNYEQKDDFLATVKRAKQRIEISLETRLAGNAVTGSIFNLKNNFGWKDKTEQELTGKDGGPIVSKTLVVKGIDPSSE